MKHLLFIPVFLTFFCCQSYSQIMRLDSDDMERHEIEAKEMLDDLKYYIEKAPKYAVNKDLLFNLYEGLCDLFHAKCNFDYEGFNPSNIDIGKTINITGYFLNKNYEFEKVSPPYSSVYKYFSSIYEQKQKGVISGLCWTFSNDAIKFSESATDYARNFGGDRIQYKKYKAKQGVVEGLNVLKEGVLKTKRTCRLANFRLQYQQKFVGEDIADSHYWRVYIYNITENDSGSECTGIKNCADEKTNSSPPDNENIDFEDTILTSPTDTSSRLVVEEHNDDYDNDGVKNDKDKSPYDYGPKSNKGRPEISKPPVHSYLIPGGTGLHYMTDKRENGKHKVSGLGIVYSASSIGCLSTGVVYRIKAHKAHKKHQNAVITITKEDLNSTYKEADKYQKRFYGFALAGLTLWAGHNIHSGLKLRKKKKILDGMSTSRNKIHIYPTVNLSEEAEYSLNLKLNF